MRRHNRLEIFPFVFSWEALRNTLALVSGLTLIGCQSGAPAGNTNPFANCQPIDPTSKVSSGGGDTTTTYSIPDGNDLFNQATHQRIGGDDHKGDGQAKKEEIVWTGMVDQVCVMAPTQ